MLRNLAYLTTILLLFGAPALAETFDHAEHLTYIDGEDCTVCHVDGAKTIAPDLKVCEDCHEADFAAGVTFASTKTHGPLWAFNHRPAAKASVPDCSACHQQDFCLECHKSGFADEQGELGNNMANVHRSDFQVTHPIAARTDPQLCSSCHENRYCVRCHNSFSRGDLAFDSHRRGWSDLTVSPSGPAHSQFDETQCESCHPDSVLPSHEWSGSHAREARKNLVTCQACHPQGDVCLQCHSARSGLGINPHPDGWNDIKGNLRRASDNRTCRKCH